MSHMQFVKNKIWVTEYGECIPYKKLSNSHLNNIIYMLETTKTNRNCHYLGIKKEFLIRNYEIAKILYEK